VLFKVNVKAVALCVIVSRVRRVCSNDYFIGKLIV
jgi:hypothetical protein